MSPELGIIYGSGLNSPKIRSTARAVLAWYFLRSLRGPASRIPKPNPKSKVQQAALQEASIYFDLLLESGAWTSDMAHRLCRYSEHRGAIKLSHGWVKTERRIAGINMSAARVVSCALSGGKAAGDKRRGLPAKLAIPPWTISKQLREAVEENRRCLRPAFLPVSQ